MSNPNLRPRFRVTWHDSGREPRCPPNPAYPQGIDIDLRQNNAQIACVCDLPYPAKRCGYFLIECLTCNTRNAVTTAGRPDDPRSITLACNISRGCAHDEGFNLFKREPELMLNEVYWRAQACGYDNDEQHEYVNGYRAARRQHDDYRRERKL